MLPAKMNASMASAKPTAQCMPMSRAVPPKRLTRRMHCAASVLTLERPRTAPVSVDGKVVHGLALSNVQRLLEQARETPTVEVTFRVHLKCGLGDTVKLVGTAPEMGRWVAEVAHFAKWTNGDVWEQKLPIQLGSYVYKVLVRKSYGEYMYELGEDRVLELTEADVAHGLVVEIRDVKVPSK